MISELRTKTILAFTGAVIVISTFIFTMYKPSPDSYTYGTLIEKGLAARGARSTIHYTIEDRSYYAYIGRHDNYPIGEKFLCHYNYEWPDHASVDMSAPVFTSSEHISWATAEITNINSTLVVFTYSVDGMTYERYQTVNGSVELSEGDMVRVAYWIEEPQRAILPAAYTATTRKLISANDMLKQL